MGHKEKSWSKQTMNKLKSMQDEIFQSFFVHAAR
jgi:hypothetical protein